MKVECLCEGIEGDIWIGTHDSGLVRFREGRCDLIGGTSPGGVYSISSDGRGRMVLGTNRGLVHVNGSDDAETVAEAEGVGLLWGACHDELGSSYYGVERRQGRPPALLEFAEDDYNIIELAVERRAQGESVASVAICRQAIWASGDRLYRLSPGRGEVETMPGIVFPRTLVHYRDGLLVGASGGVWYVRDSSVEKVVDLPGTGANSLVVEESSVWIGTYDGALMEFSDGGLRTVAQFQRPIQALLRTGKGSLWVGVYGLGLFVSDVTRWGRFDDEGFRPSCLSGNGKQVAIGSASGLWIAEDASMCRRSYPQIEGEVTAVCYDSDENLWLGTRAGVTCVTRQGRIENYERPKGVRQHRVRNLTMTDGLAWYACTPGWGVGFCDGRSVAHFIPSDDSPFPSWVGALTRTESLGLIAGSAEGKGDDWLFRLSPEGAEPVVSVPFPVSALAEFGDLIYVGTSNGLFVLSDGELKMLEASHDLTSGIVTAMAADSDTIWIGTEGGGVGRYDGQVMQSLTIPGGSLHNVVTDICLADGKAWISTEGGLFTYSPRVETPPLPRIYVDGVEFQSGDLVRIRSDQNEVRIVNQSANSQSTTPRFLFSFDKSEPSWAVTSEVIELSETRSPQVLSVIAVDVDLNYSEVARFDVHVEASELSLYVREALSGTIDGGHLLGSSEQMLRVMDRLGQVADTDLPVMLLGETGTGKTLAAKFLHRASARREAPFVQVNCGAIAEGLAEAELFGHERGAFTGSHARRIGKFQLAHGGTLFLDEVGELPPAIQVKLLHALQEQRIEPLGSDASIEVDVRIVSATNVELDGAIASRRFREDLLYRLKGEVVNLPPLRERFGDVMPLAVHFSEYFSTRLRIEQPDFTDDAVNALEQYSWPGNVRELEHTIHRALILSRGRDIGSEHLPFEDSNGLPDKQLETQLVSMEAFERAYIERVLAHTDGRIQGENGAAEILQVNPSTLRSRIKRLGLR